MNKHSKKLDSISKRVNRKLAYFERVESKLSRENASLSDVIHDIDDEIKELTVLRDVAQGSYDSNVERLNSVRQILGKR